MSTCYAYHVRCRIPEIGAVPKTVLLTVVGADGYCASMALVKKARGKMHRWDVPASYSFLFLKYAEDLEPADDATPAARELFALPVAPAIPVLTVSSNPAVRSLRAVPRTRPALSVSRGGAA